MFNLRSMVFKYFALSVIVWVLFTTAIPQLSETYGGSLFKISLNNQDHVLDSNQLTNSDVYFVIAHPDDEVMFFAPTIIELGKPQYNNKLHLICFSNGNADGLGKTRELELIQSGNILGFTKKNIHQIDDLKNFEDSMKITWNKKQIAKYLEKIIGNGAHRSVNLLTFDEKGVSKHPNHISLYYGCLYYMRHHGNNSRLFKLNSMNLMEKYSSMVLSNNLLFDRYVQFTKIFRGMKAARLDSDVIRIFADLPSVILTLAAMSFGHKSQMVWFRWGWLVFSRFIHFNEIARVY